MMKGNRPLLRKLTALDAIALKLFLAVFTDTFLGCCCCCCSLSFSLNASINSSLCNLKANAASSDWLGVALLCRLLLLLLSLVITLGAWLMVALALLVIVFRVRVFGLVLGDDVLMHFVLALISSGNRS